MAVLRLWRSSRIAPIIMVLAMMLWRARSQTDCGQHSLIAVGVIATPNYNRPTGQVTCQWTLMPEDGSVLRLTFDDFDLGTATRLEIYNGTGEPTPQNRLTTYYRTGPIDASGSGKPIVSFPGAVTLLYINNEGYYPARGFLLYFYSGLPPATRSSTESLSYVCGKLLTDGVGIVQSPGYPGWYPLNTNCTWTIKSCDSSSPLLISFIGLDLENSFDWVRLYTVPDKSLGQTTGTLIAEFTGSTLPADFRTTSSITVSFLSDSVNSQNNSGFAFKFVTDTAQAPNVNPMAVNGACPGMCPITSDATATTRCIVCDDPHMYTFQNSYYDLQEEGVFFLYTHAASPIWVQAAFQECYRGSYAKCVCAVAVRLCSELFVVDRCLTSINGQRPNRVYRAGSGALMQITAENAGWAVTLPSGLLVTIGNGAPIGCVTLKDSVNNADSSGGVCTTKYRCGLSLDAVKLNDRAYNSWRVKPGESLFAVWTAASPPMPCDVSLCKQCKKYNNYPLPAGVSNGNDLPASQFSNSSAFSFPTLTSIGRKRRDLPTGMNFSPPWTLEATLQHCQTLVAQHAGLQLCQSALSGELNLENSVNNCVLDILYTNTTDFDGTALTNAKDQCLHQLETANISTAEVRALICPSDCTNHGSCNNGSCTCSPGWLGADCSQNASQVPVLTGTSEALNCPAADIHLGACFRQLVFGSPFFGTSPGYPACSITSRSEQLTRMSAASTSDADAVKTTTVAATVLSGSVLSCRLPLSAPGQNMTYVIRVTNDGLGYSNDVTTMRIFDVSDQSSTVQTPSTSVPLTPTHVINTGQQTSEIPIAKTLDSTHSLTTWHVVNTSDATSDVGYRLSTLQTFNFSYQPMTTSVNNASEWTSNTTDAITVAHTSVNDIQPSTVRPSDSSGHFTPGGPSSDCSNRSANMNGGAILVGHVPSAFGCVIVSLLNTVILYNCW